MKLPAAITQLVKWTDKESSRYPLSGVRIGRQSGQCFAEATDGRRLALLEWKEPGAAVDGIVAGKGLAKAVRSQKKQVPSSIDFTSTKEACVNGIAVDLVDGQWPKSEDLFDPSRRGQHTQKFTSAGLRQLARRTAVKVGETSVLLDVSFLSDLADAMDACKCGSVTLTASDGQSQVLCEGDSEAVQLTAVLMPMAAD